MTQAMSLKVWIVDFKGFYCDVILPTWTISIGMQVYQTQGSDNDARTGTIPRDARTGTICRDPQTPDQTKNLSIATEIMMLQNVQSVVKMLTHQRSCKVRSNLIQTFYFFSALKLGEPHKCEIKSDCNGWVKPTITFFGEVKGQNFGAKWKI